MELQVDLRDILTVLAEVFGDDRRDLEDEVDLLIEGANNICPLRVED